MGKETLPIPFKLVRIEEKQFSVFENGLNKNDIDQKVGIGFHVDVEKNIVASGAHYLLEVEGNPFINIELVCYFEIDEDAFRKMRKQEKLVELPRAFAEHLAVITFGTARGVLFANTKGTPFNPYYMGLFNLHELIGENIIIEL